MKLQRNNKYLNKIAIGIGNLLLASSILLGCGKMEALSLENDSLNIEETIEEVRDDTPKDKSYFLKYYKISDEQRNARLNRLDIKYPNAVHRSQYVKTLVVNDNGNYKILPVIELIDKVNKKSIFYDLFTEEELFEYSFNDINEVMCDVDSKYGEYTGGYDFSKIENAIPYFNDKEIIEFGVCFYEVTFLEKHLEEFCERDNVRYIIIMGRLLFYFNHAPFNSDYVMATTYHFADTYVTTVPLEYQVTSKELGLKPTYKEEDKYFDFWKINEENIEERIKNFEIVSKEDEVSANDIKTLVLKDKDNNYKLMNVIISDAGNNVVEFYDLFTNIHLFDVTNVSNIKYEYINDKEHYYTGIDFNNIVNSIPYFDDKNIEKLDDATEVIEFITNHYEEFIEKDGINYKYPEKSYKYNIYPMDDYYLDDVVCTVEDYARNYLISLPEEMQVLSKDLKVGLDLDKAKVLER